MNNPNGGLTRGEFDNWKEEHQRYLDSQFGKLCASVKKIETQRVADWEDHKECHLRETAKNGKIFRYLWISIGGLFVVLLISHSATVINVGKAIIGLF